MATQVIRYVDPDATGAGDGTSWVDAYTSQSALITAEKKNLVVADESLLVYLRSSGGTADTTAAAWNQADWQCDATHTITLIGTDFPENGVWDSSAYRLYNNSVYSAMLDINVPYMTVKNLQIYATQNGSPNYIGGVLVSNVSGTNVTLRNLIVRGDPNSVDPWTFNGMTLNNNCDVINCVVYGWDSQAGGTVGVGILCAGAGVTHNLYNCTVYNCQDYGILHNNGTTYAYNCVVADCGNSFHGTITIANCCSDDGDGSNPQTPSGSDWDNEFTDKANGNFLLLAGGNCVNNGTDDPSSGLYDDDVRGYTRNVGTWDIGAFEYGATAQGPPLTDPGSPPACAALTDYTCNALLNHMFGKAFFTMPSLYVGLATLGGTEISGGSYARVQTLTSDWSRSGLTVTSQSDFTFTTPTSNWGAVTNIQIWDAASGGNKLVDKALTSTVNIVAGLQDIQFLAGTVTFTAAGYLEDYWLEAMLDHLFGVAEMNQLADSWLALCDEYGDEPWESGFHYDRVRLVPSDWNAAADRAISNELNITFNQPTANWGTIYIARLYANSYLGDSGDMSGEVWSGGSAAAAGANLIATAWFASTRDVTAVDPGPEFLAGNLRVRLL